MKLALVADIHANLPALQAVLADVDRWRPEQVVVLGDTINRGPHPRQCYELIRARAASPAWHVLAGNHEDYVLHVHRRPLAGNELAVHQHTHWTAAQLAGAVAQLAALPDHLHLDLPLPAGGRRLPTGRCSATATASTPTPNPPSWPTRWTPARRCSASVTPTAR